MEKKCTRCHETKDVSLFKADNRYKSGFSSYCKACHQQASVRWQKENPEKVKAGRKDRYDRNKAQINEKRKAKYDRQKSRYGRIKYLYKMSRENYDFMLSLQGGKCAICGVEQGKVDRKFSVDHDHNCCRTTPTCGKCNRGLLCSTCNTALHAVDNVENWHHHAEQYLRKFNV